MYSRKSRAFDRVARQRPEGWGLGLCDGNTVEKKRSEGRLRGKAPGRARLRRHPARDAVAHDDASIAPSAPDYTGATGTTGRPDFMKADRTKVTTILAASASNPMYTG